MSEVIRYRSKCHPESNGRKPEHGDTEWNLEIPLENGDTLILSVGKKGRDTLFGMMIADCHDSGEKEPGERDEPEGGWWSQ